MGEQATWVTHLMDAFSRSVVNYADCDDLSCCAACAQKMRCWRPWRGRKGALSACHALFHPKSPNMRNSLEVTTHQPLPLLPKWNVDLSRASWRTTDIHGLSALSRSLSNKDPQKSKIAKWLRRTHKAFPVLQHPQFNWMSSVPLREALLRGPGQTWTARRRRRRRSVVRSSLMHRTL